MDDAADKKADRIWYVSICFLSFSVLFVLEDILGPVRLSLGKAAAVTLGCSITSMVLATWAFYAMAEEPAPAGPTGWPDDPDATERLGTQPLDPWRVDDPNATQPYDPQADITTVVINRRDDSIILPPDATDPDYWNRWWAEYDRNH